ncbi:hypothetical protein Tsubulata_050409 [Turnera subulata]|uniref:ARC6 IMS domain-containing protein n=1 Tax=Turnera subulata TaxID=218843 RepID=A0A9Q0FTH4_9ROSI|nr:hypothetical protein Tsubulata_050409 [Turnera subulata]
MALAHANIMPALPSSYRCCCYLSRNHQQQSGLNRSDPKRPVGISISRVLSKRAALQFRRWILLAATADTRVLDNAADRASAAAAATVEIPVTCYQLLGVPDKAEKDEIVKSVMELKSAEVEEGYTREAVLSRQDLLMDVRDKLLFEPEYAGNLKERIPPKSSLRIPWAWLPAALCLLQEVGEAKLVLDIGRSALKHADAKPHVHDLLLSMALAECAIAKIGFEKNKVSLGFEALIRAQCLLSKTSLGKMALLSEIEESLEELAPACTLELLGMPHSPENAERRQGAIAALQEFLRQGLDVETSCRVLDWPCFLSQAFNRLMAKELVDLLPWGDLALVRKSKKSLESQNQRVVIDFNCFYTSLIAHIAFGFSSRQKEVINKAKDLCACLMTSDGIDLKFEEAFCSYLLGEGNESQAVEKLLQLEVNSNLSARSVHQAQVKEIKNVSSVKPSLETWLKDAVLAVFPDTRDCSPSLVGFFSGQKRTIVSRRSNLLWQTTSSTSPRPVSDIAMKRMGHEEALSHSKSTQHLGSAVKQLAPTNLQNPLTLNMNSNGSDIGEPSVQLERNLGAHHRRAWESLFDYGSTVGKMIFVAVLGSIVLVGFKLSVMNVRRMRTTSTLLSSKPNTSFSSLSWTGDSSLDYDVRHTYMSRSGIAGKMRKLLDMVKLKFRNQLDPTESQSSRLVTSLSSLATASRKQMPVEEAESLVKYWQTIKADALGPSHQVHSLSEILDESMLSQWQELADAAKARSCYWRFVLLQVSILQADIWSDGFGLEIAEIEALLEEAAELVDEPQQKNPNYYR